MLADSEIERNSPTSPVCHVDLSDYDTIDRTVAGDSASTGAGGPAAGLTSSSHFGEEFGDHTPRSEVPSTTTSPAPPIDFLRDTITQSHNEEVEYFAPIPQRHLIVHGSQDHLRSSNDFASSDASIAGDTHALMTTGDATPKYLALTSELDRPQFYRDHSSTSTASNATVRGTVAQVTYADSQRRGEYPHYPNQSHAVLKSQETKRWQNNLQRQRTLDAGTGQSSYSSPHVATLGNLPGDSKDARPGPSRTQVNTPVGSPYLFNFDRSSERASNTPTGEHLPHPSPFLHPTHHIVPRETHYADVTVDAISGRKIVNDYEIHAELGRGVHGKVKLGKDLHTGQAVAIKIVQRKAKRQRLGKNDSHEHKIRREVAILKKVRHPNVVSLLEVIDDPSARKVYLVLEFVANGEVEWRVPGVNEIILVEHRRFQRYSQGIVDNVAAELEDERIIRQAKEQRRKLERRKQRELRRQREVLEENGTVASTFSNEFGANSDDDDTLSRSSTTPSKQNSSRNLDDIESTSDLGRPEHHSATSLTDAFFVPPETVLEGTMYGAYDSTFVRGRTPSVVGSMRSQSVQMDELDRIPEHFHWVPHLTLTEARAAIRDTILGLEYLHYQGVVHRDIKPANLLVTGENCVKISDFGVSYIGRMPRDENDDGYQSESDAPDNEDDDNIDNPLDLAKTVGTPAFFAPELCDLDPSSEPVQVTQAIDVWAVGVTLYCLIYGRVPFWTDSNSKWAIMHVIATEDIFIPEQRLRAVDKEEKPRSRPASTARTVLMNSNKRQPHDLEYEAIGDDLRDLLQRLLTKDPRRRITLKEVKHHPWILEGIREPASWLRETAPERQTQGRRIELTDRDLERAVLPITIFDKMKDAMHKLGGAIGMKIGMGGGFGRSSGSRNRAKSSAASDSGRGPPSTVSSSSHISTGSRRRYREQRRPSLRFDEDFTEALKNSRDPHDHPLSRSLAASSDASNESPYFLAALSQPSSPQINPMSTSLPSNRNKSAKRPKVQPSVMSTATSIRTIRQSDISQVHNSHSSTVSNIQDTPHPVETSSGSALSALLGGGARFVRAMKSRDGSISDDLSLSRQRSIDSHFAGDDDVHASPSVAITNTVATGQMGVPPALLDPVSAPRHGYHGDAFRLPSRQSSISSRSSRADNTLAQVEDRPPNRNSNVSQSHSHESPSDFDRAHATLLRRRVQEDQQGRERVPWSTSNKPDPVNNQTACPPSPDDFELKLHQTPATDNSPRLATSSSEEPFPSSLTPSTSSPSVPSMISAVSSVATEGPMFSESVDQHLDSPLRASSKGLDTPDPPAFGNDMSLQEQNAADDEDSDEDEGLVMGRKRSKTQSLARSDSVSHRVPSRQHKHHGSMHSAHRTHRRGSSGTVTKVRSRSVPDE